MKYLIWTDQMDQVIRDHWPTKSARQVAAILTNIFKREFTPAMVSNRRSNISGIPAKPHFWTPEDLQYVRDNFDYTGQSVMAIAAALSQKHNKEMNSTQVRAMVQRLNLPRSFEELGWKRWSPQEIAKLRRLITEQD